MASSSFVVSVCGIGLAGLCGAFLAAQPPPPEPATGRVVLVSLDGMGTRRFVDDPVSSELRTLAAVRARGVMADGLVPHMPSTTANTHAALWTGAWGDRNGITSNEMPLAPRGEHAATRRVSGYRSDGLRAEPIWVTAARQGVRTVAQQATQLYPVSPQVTGGDIPVPPVLLHGYQAPVVAPPRWLRAGDVTRGACPPGDEPAAACVAWTAGPLQFRGVLVASPRTALRVSVDGSDRSVLVPLAPVETEPPRGRDLARHFSDGLLIDVPGVAPVMAYFRLFEASADGSSLLLFQSGLQETVFYPGRPATREQVLALLQDAGGFVGNGKSEPWDAPGPSGPMLSEGGDGTRERRYLETLELGIRQTIRQAHHLWRRFEPRLLVGYVSMPDELDHAWLGQARQDARYEALRRWGYQLVDEAASAYAGLVSPRDHIVFVSDHGMTPVTHEIRVNLALRDAGLVAVTSDGALDAAHSRVLFGRNCLLVHTTDWRDGIVSPADRDKTIDAALEALSGLRSPDDGQPVVTTVLRSDEDRDRFGFGGPNGFDVCVDYRPGYMASTAMGSGPVVRRKVRPTGEHGFMPSRPDMQGILIGAGPRLPRGATWPRQRAIDVAPLVADLLGIAPPAQAAGRSPLRPWPAVP